MNDLHRFFLATMALLGVTIFHHFYGSIIYPLVFRAYAAVFFIPVALLEWFLYQRYRRAVDKKRKRSYSVLFQLLAGIIPLLLVGLFEGGYNHFLKDVLFFSGVDPAVLLKMFPPPAYEMPDNFIFEFTGVLQFVVAIAGLLYLIRHHRKQYAIR